MVCSRSFVAVLALGAVVAVVGDGAYAHPHSASAPMPAPFGPFEDLASQVQKGANEVVKRVDRAVHRKRDTCFYRDSDLMFGCCSRIDVPKVKFNKEVCIWTQYNITNSESIIVIMTSKREIAEHATSMSSALPLCAPLPKQPKLRICARAPGLVINNDKLRICPRLDVFLKLKNVVPVSFECVDVKIPRKTG